VDAQREAYDNEYGRHDPDTGTFEFGNDAQLEYSSTLVEIAEGIRALHPNASSALSIPAAVPEGWKLVPVIADADMSHAGHMYYQQSKRDTGDFTPTGMFSAMIKASPAAPAPAVPDEKPEPEYNPSTEWGFQCIQRAEVRGWNACRAAMLNHPEQHLDMVDHSGDVNEKVAPPLQYGDSAQPVTVPAGYVLVPVEPTITILDEIYAIFDFGAEDSKDAWHRLLAAAPKAPDGWIPVSERMPEFNDEVLAWHRHGYSLIAVYSTSKDPITYKTYRCLVDNKGHEIDATHWQPLPDAPKVTP